MQTTLLVVCIIYEGIMQSCASVLPNRLLLISTSDVQGLVLFSFSKGKRSNLRTSSVPTLKLISENVSDQGASPLLEETAEEKPAKRNTRRNNKQKQTSEAQSGETETPESARDGPDDLQRNSPGQAQACLDAQAPESASQPEARAVESPSSAPQPQSDLCTPPDANRVAVVRISAAERLSAERQEKESSHGRTASKLAIARPLEASSSSTAAVAPGPRRSSVRHSLTLRRSLAGLRHSMTQESVRRASRRSFLKKKARMSSSTGSSSASGEYLAED